MEIQRSEPNTPQGDIQNLSLKDKKVKRRNMKKERQYAALTISITPIQYRGMHLLGNFRQNHSSTHHRGFYMQDHRVALLSSSLFLNKTVLDVGSGQGQLTIEIAMRYFPLQIVALDIDAKLLERAIKLVDKIVAKNQMYCNQQETVLMKVKQLPLYFQQQFIKNKQKSQLNTFQKVEMITEESQFLSKFPDNFSVLNENFMNLKADKHYDTILIMSTSKWVHLALGDKGLIALFQKAYDLLNEEGILVLEYPLYRSYQKKKNMNSLYSENMKHNINIDPLTFPSILSHMGFDMIEEINSTPEHTLKHPISLFRKGNPQKNEKF